MATLLTIKRRIKTARNVSKTTKAMQMIAASKLKKAQDFAVSSKPYIEKLSEVSKSLSAKIDKTELSNYMKESKSNKKLIIVVSPDKGLAGGLATNLIREATNLDSENKNLYITVGKKAENYLTAFGKEVIASFPFGNTVPSFDVVYPIVNIVDEYFLNGRVSEVHILTTKFISIFYQKPQFSVLLPVRPGDKQEATAETLFEPDVNELLPDLLRHYVETAIYQSLLESYASEQAARMIAMKNATDNAGDIIEELTLIYNKSRQEKITNELLDIGGGLVQ